MQIKKELFFAIKDYSYLIEKNYPINSVLKMVGDHYRLDKIERNILLRGITTREKLKIRKDKTAKIKEIKDNIVHIDGYNLLFTLSNYFNGRFCFIAMDGFVRDCANIGGRNKNNLWLEKTCELLHFFRKELKPKKCIIYLDEPVSMSIDDSIKIKNLLSNEKEFFHISISKNPDNILSNLNYPNIISTSDSIILDKTNSKAFDIIKWYFKKNKIEIFSLEKIGKDKLF